MPSMQQVRFAAEECARQQVGPLAVADMLNAMEYAVSAARDTEFEEKIILFDILWLGRLINGSRGFRKIPVIFANGRMGLAPEQIGRAIDNLLSADLTPAEFYQEFETIHPFKDGNGRVGAILYNWLNGTLHNPVTAPEYINA